MAKQSGADTSTGGLHDNGLHAVFVLDDDGDASIQLTVGSTTLKKNANDEYAVCMVEKKKKGKMEISNRKIIPEWKIIESFLKENDKGVGGLFDALRCNDINGATKIVHPKWDATMTLSKVGGWTVCR